MFRYIIPEDVRTKSVKVRAFVKTDTRIVYEDKNFESIVKENKLIKIDPYSFHNMPKGFVDKEHFTSFKYNYKLVSVYSNGDEEILCNENRSDWYFTGTEEELIERCKAYRLKLSLNSEGFYISRIYPNTIYFICYDDVLKVVSAPSKKDAYDLCRDDPKFSVPKAMIYYIEEDDFYKNQVLLSAKE